MTATFTERRVVELVVPDELEFIDTEASSVMVTREIEKVPLNGKPGVKLSVVIKRRDRMSFDESDQYWLNPHARIVTSVPEFTRPVRRYVQSHRFGSGSEMIELNKQWRQAPYDGIAELWFDSV